MDPPRDEELNRKALEELADARKKIDALTKANAERVVWTIQVMDERDKALTERDGLRSNIAEAMRLLQPWAAHEAETLLVRLSAALAGGAELAEQHVAMVTVLQGIADAECECRALASDVAKAALLAKGELR